MRVLRSATAKIDPTPARNNFKWTIPEVLMLEREYLLLNLPLSEISRRHKRTNSAILHKIMSENLFILNEEPEDEDEVLEEPVLEEEEEESDDISDDDFDDKKKVPTDEYVYSHFGNKIFNYFFPSYTSVKV